MIPSSVVRSSRATSPAWPRMLGVPGHVLQLVQIADGLDDLDACLLVGLARNCSTMVAVTAQAAITAATAGARNAVVAGGDGRRMTAGKPIPRSIATA